MDKGSDLTARPVGQGTIDTFVVRTAFMIAVIGWFSESDNTQTAADPNVHLL